MNAVNASENRLAGCSTGCTPSIEGEFATSAEKQAETGWVIKVLGRVVGLHGENLRTGRVALLS